MVTGVVCTKIGDWRTSLQLSNDVEKVLGSKFEVSDGLVKIKVMACGLCFPDVLVVEGKHMMPKPAPHIPCNEICGTVIETSKNSQFKIGDVVFGTCISGGLATEALCPESQVYKAPKDVDPNVLAGFEVNYCTAFHGLVDLANINESDNVLILGASGGVGMAAIDLCQAYKCKNIIAAASTDEKLAACKAAGANVLINYSKNTSFKDLLKESGFYGKISVVFDPVGGDLSEDSIRALGFGGKFIVIGFASGGSDPKTAIPKIPLNLALLNERQIIGCLFGAWKMKDRNRKNKQNVGTMMKLLQEGKIKPVVSGVFDFSNYEKAFEDMMNRKVIGKVVVKPFSGSRI